MFPWLQKANFIFVKKNNKSQKIIFDIGLSKSILDAFLLKIIKRKITFFLYHSVKSNIIFISLINKILGFKDKNLIHAKGFITKSEDRDTMSFYSKLPYELRLTADEIDYGNKELIKFGTNKKENCMLNS